MQKLAAIFIKNNSEILRWLIVDTKNVKKVTFLLQTGEVIEKWNVLHIVQLIHFKLLIQLWEVKLLEI